MLVECIDYVNVSRTHYSSLAIFKTQQILFLSNSTVHFYLYLEHTVELSYVWYNKSNAAAYKYWVVLIRIQNAQPNVDEVWCSQLWYWIMFTCIQDTCILKPTYLKSIQTLWICIPHNALLRFHARAHARMRHSIYAQIILCEFWKVRHLSLQRDIKVLLVWVCSIAISYFRGFRSCAQFSVLMGELFWFLRKGVFGRTFGGYFQMLTGQLPTVFSLHF